MSYDFSKLSRVPENNVLTDNTYSLIVNNDEVEKTHYESLINNIQDYSADCAEWIRTQQQAARANPISYIRSLTPVEVEGGYAPRTGYINYSNYFYMFTVMVDVSTTWYKIEEIDKNLNTYTEYLYDQSNLVEKIIKDEEDGTDYQTSVVFSNITGMTVNGDVEIDGKLEVADDAEFDNNVTFKSRVTAENPIIIDESHIILNGSTSYLEFHGDNAEVNLREEDGNLRVFSQNDESARIINVENPVGNLDAANKQFVESQDNLLKNDLLARINNRLSTTSSTGEICKIVRVLFEWDDQLEDFIVGDWGAGTGSTVLNFQTRFLYSINPSGGSKKINFLTAYYQLYNDSTLHYDLLDLSYGPTNDTTYSMFAEVDHESGPFSGGIVKFWFVYLISDSNIVLPELTALRTPYNYSGTINNYSSSTNYAIGDYCYYPNSTTGRLYKCIAATTGTWDSNDWEEVYARDSIESAFNELYSAVNNRSFSLSPGGILSLS